MQIAFNIIALILFGGLAGANAVLRVKVELALDHMAWQEKRISRLEERFPLKPEEVSKYCGD
jgi:hypothetical protein